MDPDEYAVARRTRLVEHAVSSGVDEAEAPVLVDRVLAAQRRRIARAVDPDPVVLDALESELRGPWPHRRTAALAVVAVVAAAALGGVAWWLTRPPAQTRVPSSYALTLADATTRLQSAGLRVRRDGVESCEPDGLVLASRPTAGDRVDVASTVVLRVAVPSTGSCPGAAERREAWAFLRFLRGGPAPRLDDTVYVVLDGREPAVLSRAAATDPGRWAGLGDVAAYVERVSRSGPPRLGVSVGVPPAERCGVARPAAAGLREALRLQLEPQPDTTSRCPLTVDLYRDRSGVVDAVVVYSAHEAGG